MENNTNIPSPPEPPTPPPCRVVKDSNPMIVVAVGMLGWLLILLVEVGANIWHLWTSQ